MARTTFVGVAGLFLFALSSYLLLVASRRTTATTTSTARRTSMGEDAPIRVQCANPYGNPCGPGSMCQDTATGYTCESLHHSTGAAAAGGICPLGCSPNEHCVDAKCTCDTGYHRPNPWLPCVSMGPKADGTISSVA